MKIRLFLKRLNLTELGKVNTNDRFIYIPSDIDLSSMLTNQQVMTIYDRANSVWYTPSNSNIKYVQTGHNNQKRISGVGKYYAKVAMSVGDEVMIQRVDTGNTTEFSLDYRHRNAIVFQKNKPYVEILNPDLIQPFKTLDGYKMNIKYKKYKSELVIKFVKKEKKKNNSPDFTEFYDLLIDGNSILGDFKYQDYIEILLNDMRMNKMKTWIFYSMEWED